MIHYAVAFGLLLHGAFWGAGLAMLAMPHRWRRFWPVLVMPSGWALQSAVVWFGALGGLRGTETYALWSLPIPAVLLWFGLRRLSARAAWIDVNRFGVVAGAMAGTLALLVLPLAIASRGLTTFSLGSCDAADYAAGARVLMEFAHGDREGFLGLSEVVRVQSVDNFFDYWLRLNHFTPSALVALNGSLLDCAPHELTSLFTMTLLAGSLPIVFWVARAVVGYSSVASIVIAGLYGLNPITWYAVGHVAPGQLLAAQAIAVLTWAGVALWRGRMSLRRGAAFFGVLAIAYWLILGSYNFILVIAAVPAVAYAGGLALNGWHLARFSRWCLALGVPLLATAALFPGRVAGLVERFRLLRTYDFGWRIPALGPDGWLGMVNGPDLQPWRFLGLRWVIAATFLTVLIWAVVRAWRQRQRALWTIACLVIPVIAGYVFLQVKGAATGTNASYDAYKLFAVFYPVLLPAFCWWVTLRRSHRLHEWLMVVGLAMVVLAFNVVGCAMFVVRLSRPPLMVDGELRQLRKVETMPDVRSVNLLIPDMWSRLWANAFLLRKAQYFLTHTYEGRLNTPLRGEWDLEGGVIRLQLPGAARREIAGRFALVDTRHPAFVRVTMRDGWHVEEADPTSGGRWQWTAGSPTLWIDNPHDHPLAIRTNLDGWTPVPREVSLIRAGGEARPFVPVKQTQSNHRLPILGIPPGGSLLELQLRPPAAPVGSDPRPLGICVFRLTIRPDE